MVFSLPPKRGMRATWRSSVVAIGAFCHLGCGSSDFNGGDGGEPEEAGHVAATESDSPSVEVDASSTVANTIDSSSAVDVSDSGSTIDEDPGLTAADSSTDSPADESAIHGVAVDAATGYGLVGWKIRVGDLETTTAARGVFTLPTAPSQYDLVILDASG